MKYSCFMLVVFFFKLCIRSGGNSFGRALDPRDVSGHIDRQSSIFMDADADRNRY